MSSSQAFHLGPADLLAFGGYFLLISLVGWCAARKQSRDSTGYFLGGRSLPWYVVGSSYIAANISSEQFIGMVGSACVYGICVATPEWSSIIAFTFLIWIFIPFLMAARVFTGPEFLEARFSRGMRDSFAVVTILINVVVVFPVVVYGGGLSIDTLFGVSEWPLLLSIRDATGLEPIWFSIAAITLIAGGWALYGGLKTVAWMDVLTVAVMVVGGLAVTWFGLMALAGDGGSVVDGFRTMIERNQATAGAWKDGVARHVPDMMFGASGDSTYNRLSVLQPINHKFFPWLHWVFSFFYIGLWYMAINQFMVQRIFAAKDTYHARMGIVLAGYLKLLLPFIVVLPGLILFALHPELLLGTWSDVQPEADRGYVTMLKSVVPVGLRGLFLAALFGAIQSTVSAVVNATSTVFTMDIFKRHLRPAATERELVRVGRLASAVCIVLAILIAYGIYLLKGSLFYYVQMAYSFFAPPFSAVFLLGTLWRRINARGALAAVIAGFSFALGLKLYAEILPPHFDYQPWDYATTFPIQALSTWAISMIVCAGVSLGTPPPRPEQVTDDLTFTWSRMRIRPEPGHAWYQGVTFWWALSVALMFALMLVFGVVL